MTEAREVAEEDEGGEDDKVEWIGPRRPPRNKAEGKRVSAYFAGFVLAGERVHIGDYVYLLPPHPDQELLVARIESAHANAGCPNEYDASHAMIDVRWLARPSETYEHIRASASSSELFLTDTRNAVPVPSVDGKCYVKRVRSIERASELLLHEFCASGRYDKSPSSLPQEVAANCFFVHRKIIKKPGRGGARAAPLPREELDEVPLHETNEQYERQQQQRDDTADSADGEPYTFHGDSDSDNAVHSGKRGARGRGRGQGRRGGRGQKRTPNANEAAHSGASAKAGRPRKRRADQAIPEAAADASADPLTKASKRRKQHGTRASQQEARGRKRIHTELSAGQEDAGKNTQTSQDRLSQEQERNSTEPSGMGAGTEHTQHGDIKCGERLSTTTMKVPFKKKKHKDTAQHGESEQFGDAPAAREPECRPRAESDRKPADARDHATTLLDAHRSQRQEENQTKAPGEASAHEVCHETRMQDTNCMPDEEWHEEHRQQWQQQEIYQHEQQPAGGKGAQSGPHGHIQNAEDQKQPADNDEQPVQQERFEERRSAQEACEKENTQEPLKTHQGEHVLQDDQSEEKMPTHPEGFRGHVCIESASKRLSNGQENHVQDEMPKLSKMPRIRGMEDQDALATTQNADDMHEDVEIHAHQLDVPETHLLQSVWLPTEEDAKQNLQTWNLAATQAAFQSDEPAHEKAFEQGADTDVPVQSQGLTDENEKASEEEVNGDERQGASVGQSENVRLTALHSNDDAQYQAPIQNERCLDDRAEYTPQEDKQGSEEDGVRSEARIADEAEPFPPAEDDDYATGHDKEEPQKSDYEQEADDELRGWRQKSEDQEYESQLQRAPELPLPEGDLVDKAQPDSREEDECKSDDQIALPQSADHDEDDATADNNAAHPAGSKSTFAGAILAEKLLSEYEPSIGRAESQVASQAMPAVEAVRTLAESLQDSLGPVQSAREMARRAWDGLASCGGAKAVVIGRCGLGKTRVVNNIVKEVIKSAGGASELEQGCMQSETMEHAIDVRVLTEYKEVSRIRTEQLPSCNPQEVAGCSGFLLPEDIREGTCVPTEVIFGDELCAVLEYETEEAVDRILASLRNASKRRCRPQVESARRARSCLGLPADTNERSADMCTENFYASQAPRQVRKFFGREVVIKCVSNVNFSTKAAQLCGVLSRVTRGSGSCWGCLRRVRVEIPAGGMPLGVGSIIDLPGRMDGLADLELNRATTCLAITDERKLDGEIRRALERSGFMRSLVREGSCRSLGIIVSRGGRDVCNRRKSELSSLVWNAALSSDAVFTDTLSRCSVLDSSIQNLWDSHVLCPKLLGKGQEIRRGVREARQHAEDAADAAEAIVNAHRAWIAWLCADDAEECQRHLRRAAQIAHDQAEAHLGGRLGEWGEDAVHAATQAASEVLYDNRVLKSLDNVNDAIVEAAKKSAEALDGQLPLRKQVSLEARGPYLSIAQELQQRNEEAHAEEEENNRKGLEISIIAIELLMAYSHEPLIGVRSAMRAVPAEAEQNIRERVPEAAFAAAEANKASESDRRPIEDAAWATLSHVQEECTLAVRRARKAAVATAQRAAKRILEGDVFALWKGDVEGQHDPEHEEQRGPRSSSLLRSQEVHKAVVESAGAICLQDRLDGVLGRCKSAWRRAVESRMDSCVLEAGGRAMQPEELYTCAGQIQGIDHLDNCTQALDDAVERLRAECPHLNGIPPRPWTRTQVYYAVRAIVRIFHRDERGKMRTLSFFSSEQASPHPAYALTGGNSAGQQGDEALHVPENISRDLLVWLRRQHFLALSPSLGTQWSPPLNDSACAARAAAAVGLASAHDVMEAIRTMRQRFGPGWRGYIEAASALGAVPGLKAHQDQQRSHRQEAEKAAETPEDNPYWRKTASVENGHCDGEETELAVLDGIAFLERECVGGSRFVNFGSDLLVTTAYFLRASKPDSKVHEIAERMTRSAAMRWWREHARGGRLRSTHTGSAELASSLSALGQCERLGSEDIFFMSEGLCGLHALHEFSSAGSSHTALPSRSQIEKLRRTLSEHARTLKREAFVGNDIAKGELPKTPSGRPDYRRLSESLVTIFFLRAANLSLPEGIPVQTPTHIAVKVKPYKSEDELGMALYKEQLYLVTHVVFTLTGWCHTRLSPAGMEDEIAELERGVSRAKEMSDVDLVGECLQALKCLGKSESSSNAIAEARRYLLATHDKLTGGWDSAVPVFDQRYHATVCAIGGLLEHTYSGGTVEKKQQAHEEHP